MFSLSKLLVLLLIIGGVWYGFKYAGRLQDRRAARAWARDALDRGRKAGRRAKRPGDDAEPVAPASDASDLSLCPACQAYVPARGATNCGRPDCPY
jgi:uncharacterized protein